MTTNGNEWYNERRVGRVTTNDNKWQRVVQRMKINEHEWEQVKESDFEFRMKQNMQCTIKIYLGV